MKLTKILNISMMSLLLVACGGGGDSTEATPEVAVAPVVETITPEVMLPIVTQPIVKDTLEPDPDAIYDTTAELIASRKFLIAPEYKLEVIYKSENERQAYLSICSEFIEDDNGITVNYNSCLLRTSIESDYAGSLSVANDKARLVMAIWYLDDIDTPTYKIWENNTAYGEAKRFEVTE